MVIKLTPSRYGFLEERFELGRDSHSVAAFYPILRPRVRSKSIDSHLDKKNPATTSKIVSSSSLSGSTSSSSSSSSSSASTSCILNSQPKAAKPIPFLIHPSPSKNFLSMGEDTLSSGDDYNPNIPLTKSDLSLLISGGLSVPDLSLERNPDNNSSSSVAPSSLLFASPAKRRYSSDGSIGKSSPKNTER